MKKRIAVYDPYLDTLGGGEKFILTIAHTLEKFGYETTIFWDTDLHKKIKEVFGLTFSNKITFLPNIFKTHRLSLIQKLIQLHSFDIFLSISDGSYSFSSARKNVVHCMVPNKTLYPHTVLDKIKTFNYEFITHNEFTRSLLASWGTSAQTINFPIESSISHNASQTRKPIILMVGRFTQTPHDKKQEIAISFFNKLQSNPLFSNYRLIICGGATENDKEIVHKLQESAREVQNVEVRTNVPYNELLTLYQNASYFWHFAGYGINDTKNPEQVEHFGIAPLEAMAGGCVVCCYKAGGPRYYLNSTRGVLFESTDELYEEMITLEKSEVRRSNMKKEGILFVSTQFNQAQYIQTISNIFL